MSCKMLCFITDKFIKSLYCSLLIVLVTLWIVVCVENTRQLSEISANSGRSKTKPDDGGSRRYLAQTNLPNGELTRVMANRLFVLTVFNTVLEVIVALLAIISLIIKARRLFSIMMLLLTIIWFIEQYRISDIYHQADRGDWQTMQIIIATHSIHFIIVVLGVIITLTDQIRITRVTEPIENKPCTFVNINQSNTKLSNKCQKRFDWMRSTFVKRKKSDQINIAEQGNSSPTAEIGNAH